MHDLAEGALVLDLLREPREIALRAFFNEIAPDIDELARAGGRLLAGQPLAHEHGERFLDRGIGAIADLGVIPAVITVLQHRR